MGILYSAISSGGSVLITCLGPETSLSPLGKRASLVGGEMVFSAILNVMFRHYERHGEQERVLGTRELGT